MGKIGSVIGFEFNNYEIKAVELSKSGGEYTILAYGKQKLEEGVIEEGFIREPEKFSEAFMELMKNGGFTSDSIVLGVNNENLVMRYASFPKVPDDKLRNMIFLQAQEFIPMPLQEMEMDYLVAGESTNAEDQPMLDVVLVGARKIMLEQFINVFGACKKNVKDIEPTIMTLCRAASTANPDKCYSMLNMSDGIINFMFVKGEKIFTVRSIAIPEKYYDNAQQLFKKNEESFEENLNEVGNMLASELSASISYYSIQHSMEPVENVFFIADLDCKKELVDIIQSSIAIPVEIPKFYSEFSTDGSLDINAYASCISMAMQALEG